MYTVLHVSNAGGRAVYTGHVFDLNLKGSLIDSPAQLAVQLNDMLVLDLLLGADDEYIQLQARVAHLHEYAIGVVCEHLDIESMTHLCCFLELNLGSRILLERELTEMLHLKMH